MNDTTITFRAKNSTPEVWAHAVDLVIDLLDEGKDVLLHCVHGRDRTGGVAYVVLRLIGNNLTHEIGNNLTHEEVRATMVKLRPSMAIPWSKILPDNKELYEKIGWAVMHNLTHEMKNKNNTERNDI